MVQSIKNLIAATLVAISGFLVWTQALPAYNLTSSLKATIAEKQELLNSRTEIIKKIDGLSEEYNSRFTELQRLALVVPKSRNLPEVISMIEAIFSQTGNPVTEYLIVDSSQATDVLKKVAMTISSKGTYESLYSLLDILEGNIRLFDITSLSVSEDLQSSITDGLVTEVKGNIYWLDQTVEQASTKKPASGSTD